MEDKKKLLIVDDEEIICSHLSAELADLFDVKYSTQVDQAYALATEDSIDAILLDINLGIDNGFEFCERLRDNALTKNVQIFLMTGFGNKKSHLQSYRVGADDYIEKPIDIDELKIRLSSRLKRLEAITGVSNNVGNLKVYFDRNEIELNGEVTQLSLVEIKLLKVFLSNVNKKVTRQDILKAVWPDARVEDRTVDVHVSTLRKKIKNFDHQIQSLYGSGYILKPVGKSG